MNGLDPTQNGCSADFDNVSLHTTHEVSASSNDRKRSNSNNTSDGNSANPSSDNRRSKSHTLNRLDTQSLQSTASKQQNASRARQDNLSDITVSSGSNVSSVHLRADGQVLNPNKLRPKTSALTMSMCSISEPDPDATDDSSMNGISRMIYRHYSRADYVRSEADLAREVYLIGNIKFNRWMFLPAAFCFQAICGTLYAWSVFNSLIDNELYGKGDGSPATVHKAAITFYVSLGCFGVSSSIMGPWLERNGPRKAGLLGAILFLAGNMVTAIGIHVKMISLVYAGYGILGGLGLGISYISPVSALQKWFPDRRGMAAGLAVSGFGAGSIVMAKIPDPLAAAVGLPVAFAILGLFYFVVMVICAFVFRVPPPGYVVNGLNVWAVRVYQGNEEDKPRAPEINVQELDLRMAPPSEKPGLFDGHEPSSSASATNLQTLRPLHPLQSAGPSRRSQDELTPMSPISVSATVVPSNTSRRNSAKSAARTDFTPSISMNLMEAIYSREFRLMYIMFLGNTMAGVVIISRLANIATDIFGRSKGDASTIVSINGGFNLAGRLLFAMLSDRIGRKNSYILMLTSQAIVLASLPIIMITETNWAFLTTIFVLTSCYGGGFGCIPAFLCDMFGPCNIGPLHGVILTSWSLSSVGAGLLFTAIYNYLLNSGYTVHDSITYTVNLHWLLAGALIGLFMTFFVRTETRDRLLPSLPGEIFHIRVFGRILRAGRFGISWVTKDQEHQEWTEYVNQRQREDEQGHQNHSRNKDRALDTEEKALGSARSAGDAHLEA
ncbi:hypothetical protein BGZ51_001589 [Haplosporangium sp. Z 767]|nr:hypothetical protein BGZ50_002263 [Haplosporangium sp. Z 11]KAF9187017.1 hypothetical protein BGZ51_001589 [Haplosporangium sp. Z 767]